MIRGEIGEVYHVGSAADVMELLKSEQGVVWQAHPRTRAWQFIWMRSATKDCLFGGRFIGASWESLPADLSAKRLCKMCCFGTLDDMNNWAPGPKYMIAVRFTVWDSAGDGAFTQPVHLK